MKTEIKRLSVENFKGIKSFTVEFAPTRTHLIVGDNRAGKTSFFDSWMWLIFGCDSCNHVKLSYAPLDDPKSSPVVEAVVQINGEEVILVKNEIRDERGTKNQYSINGKKCTMREYQEKLATKAGVWMTAWKTLTNPLGFYYLSQEEQLDMLFMLESPTLFDEVPMFNKLKKEAKDLKKQITQYSAIQKEIEDLEITCPFEGHKLCEDKQEELQEAINMLTEQLLEKEEKMMKLWKVIHMDLVSVQNTLNSILDPISINLFKETSGEVAIDCEIFWNRIPLKNLSFSEKILCGLHLIKKFSESTDFYPPVWIDNAESLMSMPDMRNQLIILAAMPGIPLTYRPGGRHGNTSTRSKAKRTV